jgi:hypothetical protein
LRGARPAWNPGIVAGDRTRPARSRSSSNMTPPRALGRARASARRTARQSPARRARFRSGHRATVPMGAETTASASMRERGYGRFAVACRCSSSSNSIASGASIEPRQTAGFVTEQQSRPALPLVVGMRRSRSAVASRSHAGRSRRPGSRREGLRSTALCPREARQAGLQTHPSRSKPTLTHAPVRSVASRQPSSSFAPSSPPTGRRGHPSRTLA